MSMHTYIGARYVPRFVGTYDATQIYEALDVVDNGSGTSYIARKTVPAGTPLTDTDHWFVYGASSGAIIALQNDMIQAQNDILQAQSDITDLENAVYRSFIVISDSYALRQNADGDTFNDLLQSWLDLPATRYYHNEANGASFYNGTPSLKFEYLLQNVTVADADAITDILVIGGANDWLHSASDILTEIASFMTYAKANYPNAQVTILPVGLTFTATGITRLRNNVMPAYNRAQKYGAACIVNAQYVLQNSYLLDSDACHPIANGVDRLADAIYNWIVTGEMSVNYYADLANTVFTPTVPANPQTLTVPGGNVIMKRHNGSFSVTGKTGTFIRIASTAPMDIPVNECIRLESVGSLIAGDDDNNSYLCFALDHTSGKIYPCYLNFTSTAYHYYIQLFFPTGISVADNVTNLRIFLSMSDND